MRVPAWEGRRGASTSAGGLVAPASVTPASQGAMGRTPSSDVDEMELVCEWPDEVDDLPVRRRALSRVGLAGGALNDVLSPSSEPAEDVEGYASPGLERINAGGSVNVGESLPGVHDVGIESDLADCADALDEVLRWPNCACCAAVGGAP